MVATRKKGQRLANEEFFWKDMQVLAGAGGGMFHD
jgi:hypothetical protein